MAIEQKRFIMIYLCSALSCPLEANYSDVTIIKHAKQFSQESIVLAYGSLRLV